MKKLLLLLTAAMGSFLLTSCAGVLDKATIAYGKASDKFESGTGITLGQGFSILTGAYRSYSNLKDANKLSLNSAGSPLPAWSTTSAKAVQPDPQPAPVQAQPAGNWWNTLFF